MSRQVVREPAPSPLVGEPGDGPEVFTEVRGRPALPLPFPLAGAGTRPVPRLGSQSWHPRRWWPATRGLAPWHRRPRPVHPGSAALGFAGPARVRPGRRLIGSEPGKRHLVEHVRHLSRYPSRDVHVVPLFVGGFGERPHGDEAFERYGFVCQRVFGLPILRAVQAAPVACRTGLE